MCVVANHKIRVMSLRFLARLSQKIGPVSHVVRPVSQCSAKGLNWKKMALKRKIHGWDRMIMLNTGSALKYSNLVEATTFLGKN